MISNADNEYGTLLDLRKFMNLLFNSLILTPNQTDHVFIIFPVTNFDFLLTKYRKKTGLNLAYYWYNTTQYFIVSSQRENNQRKSMSISFLSDVLLNVVFCL